MDYQLPLSILSMMGATVAGLLLGVTAKRKENLFWPVLTALTIVTTGLDADGYGWLDEIAVTSFLAGEFSTEKYRINANRHLLIFLVFGAYFLVQSVRGVIVLESIRKIRWVYFHILIMILAVRLANVRARASHQKLSVNVALTGLLLYAVYVLYGMAYEAMGISRYLLQNAWVKYGESDAVGAIWAPTALVSFPVIAVMVGIIGAFRLGKQRWRIVAYVGFAAVAFMAMYYDSRSAVLAVITLGGIGMRRIGAKRAFALIVIVLLVFTAGFVHVNTSEERYEDFVGNLYSPLVSLFSKPEDSFKGHDVDRAVLLKAGISAVTESWYHFLFGYGYRVSGWAVAPHFFEVFQMYKPQSQERDAIGVEGITAFMVDGGIVGLVLLCLNFWFSASAILQRKDLFDRFLLLTALCLTFLWLAIIYLNDTLLMFLTIMPNGMLLQFRTSKRLVPGMAKQTVSKTADLAPV